MSRGPVAVIVLSHRNPEQVARLVKRVTAGADTVAVIHHDPAGPDLGIGPASDVAVIPDPVSPAWGRLSLVQAQWNSLRWVAENIPEFSWALLISGQDYPVRSAASIEAELAASPYDAYLRHFRVGKDPAEDEIPWQALTRHRYLHKRRIPFSHRSVPLPVQRRHPYRGDTALYVGDMWFNLSARAVHAMLDARPLADRLLRYLKYAPIPDETFICSMALNADPSLRVAAESRRFIKWGRREPHPQLLTAAHLPEIRQSNAFFARKIDMQVDPELPDLLDRYAAEAESVQ